MICRYLRVSRCCLMARLNNSLLEVAKQSRSATSWCAVSHSTRRSRATGSDRRAPKASVDMVHSMSARDVSLILRLYSRSHSSSQDPTGPEMGWPILAQDISRDCSCGRRNMGQAGDMSQYLLPWVPVHCNFTGYQVWVSCAFLEKHEERKRTVLQLLKWFLRVGQLTQKGRLLEGIHVGIHIDPPLNCALNRPRLALGALRLECSQVLKQAEVHRLYLFIMILVSAG